MLDMNTNKMTLKHIENSHRERERGLINWNFARF